MGAKKLALELAAATEGVRGVVDRLRVAPADKGWVIGRKGRVANAIRSLLRVAAPSNRHIVLEIL